ncbi:MAG: FG-GAP repeat protein [Planctomycetaceae bacterium]|nr:FG-GAP repeat protein [Planctomycetaceae bacterium]
MSKLPAGRGVINSLHGQNFRNNPFNSLQLRSETKSYAPTPNWKRRSLWGTFSGGTLSWYEMGAFGAAQLGFIGDYDGNGKDEVMAQVLVVHSSPPGIVGAMRSQEIGSGNRFYVTLNSGYEVLATGDFNGDGYDDVVGLFDNGTNTRANIIPAYSIDTPVGRRFTSVLASGQFGQSVATGGLHDLTVADFNGDGRDDIAVVNANGQIFTATTVGNARGNAVDVRNFVASAASPRLDPATYSNPIIAGNINNDLLSDIFTIRDNDQLISAISTLTGNGTPSQSLVVSGTSTVGENFVLGDLDGDGLEDIIVLGTTVSAYQSLGTTFGPALNFGNVIGGAIGQMGAARTGRVM